MERLSEDVAVVGEPPAVGGVGDLPSSGMGRDRPRVETPQILGPEEE